MSKSKQSFDDADMWKDLLKHMFGIDIFGNDLELLRGEFKRNCIKSLFSINSYENDALIRRNNICYYYGSVEKDMERELKKINFEQNNSIKQALFIGEGDKRNITIVDNDKNLYLWKNFNVQENSIESSSKIAINVVKIAHMRNTLYILTSDNKLLYYIDSEHNGRIRQENDVIDVSCGDNHCLFLTKDKKVFGFGSNHYGQLGLGRGQKHYKDFIEISFEKSIMSIYTGANASGVIDSDGNAWVFGNNSHRQLIYNADKIIYTPSLFDTSRIGNTIVNIQKISFSHTYTIVMINDSLYGQGNNDQGQLGFAFDPFPYQLTKIPIDQEIVDFATSIRFSMYLNNTRVISYGYDGKHYTQIPRQLRLK